MRLAFIVFTAVFSIGASVSAFSESAAPAAAPASNGNLSAKETPWTVSCQPISTDNKSPDGKTADSKVDCSVTKQVVTQDGNTLIAQVSVIKKSQELIMRVIVPHQLNLQSGLGFFIDDKDAGTKQFTTSLPIGVVALFGLDDSILAIIRKGQILKLTAKSRTNQEISIPLSLNGFATSLDKMMK